MEAKTFTSSLFYAYTEIFENVVGMVLDKGTSMFETLATITPEVASRPVGKDCATIAAQVEHVRFYIDVLEKYIKGAPPKDTQWGDIWANISVVNQAEWDATIARLRSSYERVRTYLESVTEWQGDDDFGGAIAIVVHTAYHLGEIRQATCTVGD